MYNFIAQLCERILRIPPPPEPPPGDECSTRSFRAAPNFYRYLLFKWGIKTAATSIGLLVWFLVLMPQLAQAAHRKHLDLLMVLVTIAEILGVIGTVAFWVYSWFTVRLDFDKRWYVVTDRSLRVREGILTVREATVTFANIQNISVSQGPLQRILGIADLRVDTAGGGGAAAANQHGMPNLHTTFFRGVDNAPEIRELMQKRLRQLKDAGLGDHEDNTELPTSSPAADMLEALRQVHEASQALRSVAAGQRS